MADAPLSTASATTSTSEKLKLVTAIQHIVMDTVIPMDTHQHSSPSIWGRSFVHSFNHNLHKREAEPSFGLPAYGYGYGGGIGYGIGHTYGYGPAVAYHPYGGLSFTRSYNHVLHKRDADPSYGHTGSVYGYTSSVSHPGYGYSYQQSHGFVPSHYASY
ncbi:shematrin-like protein 1 [Penaeus monodon]|uniref:shematrin-like protein 1 n=1 Tax=Penaeus monodon TaxID=6687 RepID=UPI0018A761B1|nr:shematrin-like protein 1 [Penaeus monodon]